jgi:hypothetical protein
MLQTMSSMQLGLGAAGLGLGAIGLLTGSQGLVTAGMVLQTAAVALEVAVIVMKATGILHSGGVIAHGGLLIAHSGLAPDERLIKAQVGEGIIKRSTMLAYARAGISFNDLNNGRLPFLMPPAARAEASPRGGDFHYHDNSTFNIGGRADIQDFRRELWRHREELKKIVQTTKRNFAGPFG